MFPLGERRSKEYGDGGAASNSSEEQVLSKIRNSSLGLFWVV